MRKTEFNRLPEFTNETEKGTNDLNIGDNFLFGVNMIGQKQNKTIGQAISYYQVISKSEHGIEYTPIFDYMEKDKGEERK